jgi:alkylation response protein AidB-like acyl-CoA dehydrogenase
VEVDFTEEQRMLARTACEFLKKECPKNKVRQLEEDEEKGYCPEMWSKMAKMGWIGLMIPKEYGGMGMTFQDLAIVLEEMGRNITPGPFFCTVIEGILPILAAGTEEQKGELLPKIAGGELILTMALLEGNCIYDASQIATKAVVKDGLFAINGTKLFVEMAHVADYLICVTRTRQWRYPQDGISLFIVDTKSHGVQSEVIPTMGMDKLCEVEFHNAPVPQENLLGQLHKGWATVEGVLCRATLAKCAESVGGLQAVADMCIQYCNDRIQYDRPIGTFQALQHMLVDMWIAMTTSRYLVYKAIWMETEGLACAREVAMAKSYVNETYKRVTDRALTLHGAIGTCRDHDMGLYYRRAKTADIAFGSTDFHREKVACEIGLVS